MNVKMELDNAYTSKQNHQAECLKTFMHVREKCFHDENRLCAHDRNKQVIFLF